MPAKPVSRFVAVNGVRLHYLDFAGDGPTAVLHHATGFHSWVWTPIAEALAGRYRVYAIDGRGHGDSDKPVDGYQWEAFVADFTAFVEFLDRRPVFGIGHSLGATATAGAAAARPDLFRAVVLLDPIFYPRESRTSLAGEHPIAAAARRRREVWGSHDEVFESYQGRGPFAKWRDDVLRLYVDHGFALENGGVRLKCPPPVEAQVYRMAASFDPWAAVERLRLPVLVVRGAQSTTFSAKDAAETARRLPDGKLVTLEGASHTFPMEQPGEVARAILDFAEKRL